MIETTEVVALVRQMYAAQMYDPGEYFTCDPEDARTLEILEVVRLKTDADPPAKQKRYNRRDMRAAS